MEGRSSPAVRANSLQDLSPIHPISVLDTSEDYSMDEDSDLKFLDLAGLNIN
jgi:hypothetical protein